MSQGLNSALFLSKLPASWEGICQFLLKEGFVPTLVGGTVRDFFLNESVGADWDIELTHATLSFSKDSWKNLGKELSKFGKVSFLPYEIIRLDASSVQYEFSPPRKEIFHENWNEGGHSNFTAEFDLRFPFAQAIERRDFTINAMGIRFLSSGKLEFLDPLNGLLHLREKLLHPCGENFEKDPVRFLRALRMAQKMKFQFTPELQKILERMPVANLSASYLWSEMQKSAHPLSFLRTFYHWQELRPELNLPVPAEILKGKWDELSQMLMDGSRHECFVIALEWVGVSSSSWQRFFSLSPEICQRLGRWAQASKSFLHLLPEKFQGEFEEVRDIPEFETLFDWYFTTKQLLQKNPSLPLLEMIARFLPDWVHLYRFEPVKDVRHIDPPFRAKYQVWNLCQRL